jgi:hypothetical protein
MEKKAALSDTALLLAALGVFGVLAIATGLLSPAMVARFYPLPPDTGAAWYYWQLANTTTLARITYWAGYAAHQIVLWVVLFKAVGRARKDAADGTARQVGVGRFNIIAMGLNIAFVALHLVQTYFWYDGLAQDVPIWTSQGSVIVMLVLVLYLEIPRRGLFWGKRFNPAARTYKFVRNWHGIYIAWAVTYTFWFHPMDGNWGLLSGFIYIFLLFIQLSMFNTRLHSNMGWVILMESFVAVHATLITIYKDNPIWPMFMVGFLVMLVFTQMHGLPWARKLRWPITIAFVLGVAALYVFVRGTEHVYEVTFIPVALYGGALALVLIGWAVDRIVVVRRRVNA